MSIERKAFLSNTLGNTLEWYDFTLYGTLAPIIAQQFFPSSKPLISFLVETAPVNKRGFAGSLALVGVLGGILLGVAVVTVTTVMFDKATLSTWGWRVPFLLGGILGFIVFLLRRNVIETPAFTQTQHDQTEHHTPLETCLLYYKKPILKAFGITIFNAFAFYILMIYTTTYFNRILNFSMEQSTMINLFMVGLTLILVPAMGKVADVIGHKKTLLISSFAFIVLGYPMNVYFLSEPTFTMFLLGQAVICIFLAMYLGPMAVVLAELIPTRVRHTGLSLAYNTALALFGGTAPLLVTYMIEKTHSMAVPGHLLTGSAIVSFLVLLTIPELNKQPLK